MSSAGDDLISGDLGSGVDRAAVGKGIQQMIVALGDAGQLNSDMLRKVLDIVLGDGILWDGVMKELERLRAGMQTLTAEMQTLKTEVKTLQTEMHERRETSAEILWTLRITLGLIVVFLAVYVWQVW